MSHRPLNFDPKYRALKFNYCNYSLMVAPRVEFMGYLFLFILISLSTIKWFRKSAPIPCIPSVLERSTFFHKVKTVRNIPILQLSTKIVEKESSRIFHLEYPVCQYEQCVGNSNYVHYNITYAIALWWIDMSNALQRNVSRLRL